MTVVGEGTKAFGSVYAVFTTSHVNRLFFSIGGKKGRVFEVQVEASVVKVVWVIEQFL